MNSAMRGACFVLVITGSILAIKILYKRLRRPPANGCNLGRAKTLSNSVNTVQKGQPYDPSHPTIVIIGAGAVGLSTAYELAKANHALQQKQNIAVVDVYDSPFGATSNWNTGILGYSEFPPKLRPLGEYSFSLWQQLAQTAQFRERCGFKECSNFSVSSGGGDGLQLLPNWIRKCRWWDAWRDPPKAQSAIIHPTALGSWLYDQCVAYGVQFYMNTKIFSANLSFSNQIQSLGVVSGNEKQGTLQCDKLIIAAGPWTPGLFNTLFPDSKVDLQPAVDAGDWIICQNTDEPLKSSSDIAAVFLDDIVGHKLEFAGRNDGTIWACCERNHSAIMPPVGEEAEPDDLAIHKLTDYAQEFIIGAEDSLKVVQSGRAFRPARKKGLPVIAAVPTRKLTRNGSWFGHGCIADSVYICSGHGSYGITLGIGSGRLISQIVRGEKPDIDLSEMGIE